MSVAGRIAGVVVLLLAPIVADAQCPPPVSPKVPADGLTTTETHINFAWDPAGSNVSGYDLMLSQNGAPATAACFNSPSPNCSVTLGAAKYEWFVRSYVDGCPNGTESAHFHLTVNACSAPVAPATLTPDGGALTGTTTTLTWSGGSADTYDVILEPGSACTSTTPLNATPLAGESFTVSSLTRGATYAWRVRAARGSTCPAPQISHCATFSVRACDPPAAFAPSSPQNGATNVATLVTLNWTPSAGAASYAVYARTNSNAPFSLAGTSPTTSLLASFAPSATVEWYVEAISGSCTTASAHQTFTTAGCSGATPLLLAPSGTLTAGAPIVFRWSAVPGADRYRLWIAPAGGNAIMADETPDLSATAHRPPGTYDWYVEAIGASCPAARSATNRIVVPHASSCPAPPALTAPANGASVNGTIGFTWTAVAGASRYDVWASIGGAAPALLATRTANALNTDLAPGVVTWYVVAHVDGCDDLESATSSFTVTQGVDCSTAAPLLIAPADGATRIPSSTDFFWTNVAGAQQYRLWAATDDGAPAVVATTGGSGTRSNASVAAGRVTWFVEAIFPGCGSRRSAPSSFYATAPPACAVPDAPSLYLPGGATAGVPYELHWTARPNVDHYEVLESVGSALPASYTTKDVMLVLQHDVAAPAQYRYRVRAVSNCGAGTSPFSSEAAIVVTPSSTLQAVVPFGTSTLTRTLFVPGLGAPGTFAATSDRPWLTIAPPSGTLPANGITLTLTADLSRLDAGTTTTNVSVSTARATSSLSVAAATAATPVSVSLVTPSSPSGKSSTTSNALVLPAVAHLDGNTTYSSDVRLLNNGPRPQSYRVTFTPTGTDATASAQQTVLQVAAGSTVALDDILQSFFGVATAGASSFGALEIAPLAATSDPPSVPSVTFVSSRTLATTSGGTAGQFVPGIPLSSFAGRGATTASLTLPQIAQAGAFRTNLGLLEAATQPAHVILTFFDAFGNALSQMPVDLLPGEHTQLNSIVTSSNALAAASRVDVDVTSATGLVTAYASVLDQQSNAPILVTAVPVTNAAASEYVIPGVASLGAANGGRWRSDLRIFNASSSPQPVTITFRPQGASAAPQQVSAILAANEVRALDDVVRSMFGTDNVGGSVAVTTSTPSRLFVGGRTYFDGGSGTLGQFIPALTETSGVAAGDRPLEILQVEQSDNYRTNVGLVELSGATTTVTLNAIVPELKSAPTATVTLQPNEFRQLDSLLAQMGVAGARNARVEVRVTGGSGRVSAYGSLIDNSSGAPTYIPAQ